MKSSFLPLFALITYATVSTAQAFSIEDRACSLVSHNIALYQPDGTTVLDAENTQPYIETLDRLEGWVKNAGGKQIFELTQLRRVNPKVATTILEYNSGQARNFITSLDPGSLPAPSAKRVIFDAAMGAGGTLALLSRIFFPDLLVGTDSATVIYGLTAAFGWTDFARNSAARAAQKRFQQFVDQFGDASIRSAHAITLRTRGEALKSLDANAQQSAHHFVDLTLIHYPFEGHKSLIVAVQSYDAAKSQYSDQGTIYYDSNFANDYGTAKPDFDGDGIPDNVDGDIDGDGFPNDTDTTDYEFNTD
jgi:hypothetical protein